MSDDRSRDERATQRSSEAGPREPWYERLLHLFSLKAKESIREDIEEALAETDENDDVSPKERAMLKNVLELHRVRVDDVMVPRSEIVAVTADTSLAQLLAVFRNAGHSRLPVYGETIDDAKGMIHIRDVVGFLSAQTESAVGERREGTTAERCTLDLSLSAEAANLVRPVLFAPPSMPAIDLLVRMQATHTHMALVVDEYGGTDGLVTIENLVERVVGEIEDEHDVDSAVLVQQCEDLTFLADARAKLEKVSEVLKVDLTGHDLADDIDTLGGLVTTLAGRVPAPGDLIPGPNGLRFEVLEADPRRLKKVRITFGDVAAERSSVASDALPPEATRPAAFSATPGPGPSSSAA
jgi:CBS domain containing-hemolysin-like protein